MNQVVTARTDPQTARAYWTMSRGDSDSDVKAVTVQPERPSPAPQATIETPAANSRIA